MFNKMISPRSSLLAMAAAVMLLPVTGFAAGAGAVLQPANNDLSNLPSLQRGARNFVNYCMGCHSAKYVRYNRLGADLSISDDQMINNLMFAAEKTTETMTVAMPADDAARWFGQAPPDLSLVARSLGTDHIYTFLRTFYVEEGSPTGANNLVLANASMPNVLWSLQGEQRLVVETDAEGHKNSRLELVSPGSLSPEEFDQFVRDIVNFLDYVGEPMQLERQRLGGWVIAFLLVFGVFAYLLKEEIWTDIEK
jgi:ubiquinol-cytochrome c reductase cytochrome c1 subunit